MIKIAVLRDRNSGCSEKIESKERKKTLSMDDCFIVKKPKYRFRTWFSSVAGRWFVGVYFVKDGKMVGKSIGGAYPQPYERETDPFYK